MDIISEFDKIVKWVVPIDPTTDLTGIPDGIYPFSGLNGDQWALVVGEQQVNWAPDYGKICLTYAEAMRVKREHAQRCPGDSIPASWYTVNNGVDDFSVDRETGKVTL